MRPVKPRLFASSALLATLLVVTASPAGAQTQDQRTAARAAAEAGGDAYDAGKYGEAADLFAEQLQPEVVLADDERAGGRVDQEFGAGGVEIAADDLRALSPRARLGDRPPDGAHARSVRADQSQSPGRGSARDLELPARSRASRRAARL